ncbi:uncharacterized protein LOC143562414 [Bidens hawaiensis]|uniref:uncharacterized protein LOC143562414 n=1 Tax=Bidens hawaiensis TaxID=980011 RepID=UPI00404A9D17
MTSLQIQKEVINCFAEEVLKQIFEELGNDVFSILVDESRDVSKKEQMALVLRYVDKSGLVKERFIGLVHVKDTTTLSLKHAIDELFARYSLSLTKVRGQGYDGASNMAEVSTLTNVVCASCKQIDMIRESQKEKLKEAIGLEEVETGSGLNQELSIARAGDTRWSSHHKRLTRLLQLYPSVIEVLEYIRNHGDTNVKQRQANGI